MSVATSEICLEGNKKQRLEKKSNTPLKVGVLPSFYLLLEITKSNSQCTVLAPLSLDLDL